MGNQDFKQTVYVNRFTDGTLDPNVEMSYHVKDKGNIIANTTPGCWGPMITPELKGGHEVTQPVFVEGAEVGDAIAIKINSIRVTSVATASGHDQPMEGRFTGDPFVAGICPNCGAKNPKTVVKGIGQGRSGAQSVMRMLHRSLLQMLIRWGSMKTEVWGLR